MPTLEALIAIPAIFLLGGLVKGVAGIGLPTVAIVLMAVFIGLKEGIALMVVPTLATNIWQALSGGRLRDILQRFWSLLVAAALGAWLGASILAGADATMLAALLGGLLCLYSAISLTAPPVPSPGRAEVWLSPIVGGVSGLIGGMTGSYSVPGVLYLQALRLGRDLLVQTLGVVFVVFTFSLGAGLTRHGLMSPTIALLSVAATIPALAGMAVGQRLRRRLSEEAFRRIFFVVLFALGAWLMARPLIG
jgi:uncharacterized protein